MPLYVIKHQTFNIFKGKNWWFTTDIEHAKIYQRRPKSLLRHWLSELYNTQPLNIMGVEVFRRDFIFHPITIMY